MGLRATQRHMHARSKDGRPPPATASSPSTNNGRQGGGLATDDDDDDEATILPALRAAVHLFAHAVNTPPLHPHPGALYSLGVLWKLYPRLMARVIGVGVGWPGKAGGVSEAYRHLCLVRRAHKARRSSATAVHPPTYTVNNTNNHYHHQQSRDAFIAELARRHQKQCAGVSLLGPAEREGGAMFDGQTTLWYV